jgi:hypothetical protein
MNPEHKWIDELVREWIGKIDNERLLAEWQSLMDKRRAFLREVRRATGQTLIDGLKRCSLGDVLHCELPGVSFGESRETKFYFFTWQPRARRLWVYPLWVVDRHDRREARAHSVYVTEHAVEQLQIGRTDIATRLRAALVADREPEPPEVHHTDHAQEECAT